MDSTTLTPAERVALLIKKLDVSTYQFGKATGISHQTLSNVLAGKNKPGLDTLQAIAAMYPAAAIFLLTGEGEPFPQGRYNEKAADQLPPQVPSELKPLTAPAAPGKQTDEELRRQMTIVAESAEMREVKSERDHLREMNKNLLAIIRNFSGGATDASAAAGGGKANASSDAASLLETVDAIAAEYQSQDRIFVAGLWRSGGRHLRIA